MFMVLRVMAEGPKGITLGLYEELVHGARGVDCEDFVPVVER